MRSIGKHVRSCALGALALCAASLGACQKPIAWQSQGASVRDSSQPAQATVALANLQAPAWALARNNSSQSIRAGTTRLDASAFPAADAPDFYRPRRLYYSTQENTLTFFRLEGAQYREQRQRIWVP